MGSPRFGSGSNGMWKYAATSRKARKPDRMHRLARGTRPTSTDDDTNAAASSTAPAAVIHERSCDGERKNTRDGYDVWLSAMSANHSSHVDHWASSASRP